MELTVKEWLMVLAMVDRLHTDNILLGAQVVRLSQMLVKKGILSEADKAELANALHNQREASRRAQAAEDQPGNPAGEPFHHELSQELRALGVISDNPTIGDTLQAGFDELLGKVLERFRKNREDGDAGKTMRKS